MAHAPLSKRRLLGLDRSGGPHPATRRGQPLRPWTVPNLIGFVRLALIPVFLLIALTSGDGRSAAAAALFLFICFADYFDGVTARLTGQYSRLGALLDPFIDRLLVVAAVVVCYRFELLPRWALAVLAAREIFMLVATRIALWRGFDLNIRMIGRMAVWPLMAALTLAMVSHTAVADILLYIGLVMTLAATFAYIRDTGSALRP